MQEGARRHELTSANDGSGGAVSSRPVRWPVSRRRVTPLSPPARIPPPRAQAVMRPASRSACGIDKRGRVWCIACSNFYGTARLSFARRHLGPVRRTVIHKKTGPMARALGLDFGTTNTVLALPDGGRTRTPSAGSSRGSDEATLRSALCFGDAGGCRAWRRGRGPSRSSSTIPTSARFLQSLKTFAASPYFQGTCFRQALHVRGAARDLFRATYEATATWPDRQLPRRLVVGRPSLSPGADPIRSAGQPPLREAWGARIHRNHYPSTSPSPLHSSLPAICAATRPSRCRFGGGTTDFSIMRFEREEGAPARRSARPFRRRHRRRPVRLSASSTTWCCPASARAASIP